MALTRWLSGAASPAGRPAERGAAAAALASLLRSSSLAGAAATPAYSIHPLAQLHPLTPSFGLRRYGADAAAAAGAPPAAAPATCWQCGVPLAFGYQYACAACDAIQPAMEDPDYFEMFGL